MKKYFKLMCAFAAICAMCLSSCTKENAAEKETEPEQESTAQVTLYAARFDGQEQYVDQSFDINIDGKNVSVTFDQMQKATKSKSNELYFDTIERSIILAEKEDVKYTVYTYSVGTISKGQTVKSLTKTFKAKSGRPSGETTDILDSYALYAIGTTAHDIYDAAVHAGVYNDDSQLEAWCKIVTKTLPFDYTVK